MISMRRNLDIHNCVCVCVCDATRLAAVVGCVHAVEVKPVAQLELR